MLQRCAAKAAITALFVVLLLFFCAAQSLAAVCWPWGGAVVTGGSTKPLRTRCSPSGRLTNTAPWQGSEESHHARAHLMRQLSLARTASAESLLPAEEFLSVRGVHRHCRRFQQPPNLPHDASQSCTHCVSADCYTSFAGGPQGASSAGGMAVVDSLEVLAELAGGECPVFLDRAPVVGHLHPPNYSPNTTTCLCASINVAN